MEGWPKQLINEAAKEPAKLAETFEFFDYALEVRVD